MASATTERPEFTKLLIEAGAPVDEVTLENNYTALHWALLHRPGNSKKVLAIIKILLEHGAAVNAIGKKGVTPLIHAAWFGIEDAVKLLLQNGADKKFKNEMGYTAQDVARDRKYPSIEKLLALN